MRELPIWDLSNRFGSFGIVNGTARLFLARSDGGLDYFPRGMRKPGYHVDAQIRDRIMEQARELRDTIIPLLVTYLCIAIGLFFVSMSEIPVPTGEPPGLPVAVWWEIAAAAVFILIILAIKRPYRHRAMALLKSAPTVNMPGEEYRELVVKRWKEAKWRWPTMFIVVFGAMDFMSHGSLAGADHWLHLAIAGVFVVAILQFAIEAITVWRWSRACTGRYSDSISRQ